tara:strand:- start:2195 stop:2341 length:147 start_codon:yes stop_codon:yes gene_type:complete
MNKAIFLLMVIPLKPLERCGWLARPPPSRRFSHAIHDKFFLFRLEQQP